jgi:hypothetical protein
MEACLIVVKVSFKQKLLGQKNSTHIQFNNSSDNDKEEELVVCDNEDNTEGNALQEGVYLENVDTTAFTTTTASSKEEYAVDTKDSNGDLSGILAKILKLNETQERAKGIFSSYSRVSSMISIGYFCCPHWPKFSCLIISSGKSDNQELGCPLF